MKNFFITVFAVVFTAFALSACAANEATVDLPITKDGPAQETFSPETEAAIESKEPTLPKEEAPSSNEEIAPAEETPRSDEEAPISFTEYQYDYMSFPELVANSNAAIIGKYVETVDHGEYIEHAFEVVRCLYGGVTDGTIYLYRNIGVGYVGGIGYSYDLTGNVYETDKEYILILECHKSIMYDHDRYLQATDALLCLTDGVYTMYSEPLDTPSDMTIEQYILSLCSHQQAESYAVEETPTYQNRIDELFGESELVGRIRIDELDAENTNSNANLYRCSVVELFKGTEVNTYDDGTFLLSITKDTVTVGSEYIIGFASVGPYSYVHKITYLTSVFEIDDEILFEVSAYTK